MKQLLAILFAAVLLLSCAACRSSDGIPAYLQGSTPTNETIPTDETESSVEPTLETLSQMTFGPQPDDGIFNLDNVVRITFFSYYGQGTGSDVPAEHMQEIMDWLATFTLGEQAPNILPPGTNTVYIEIEYDYEAIFRTGMDTVDFAGTIYYITGNEPPACYGEILEGTSLP